MTGHLLVRPIINGAFAVKFYPRQGSPHPEGELLEITVESEIELVDLLDALQIAGSSGMSPQESKPDREHLRYFPADLSEERMRELRLLGEASNGKRGRPRGKSA
jgi:hypothetical protein